MKTCKICNLEKPNEAFPKNSGKCLPCFREAGRIRSSQNYAKDRIKRLPKLRIKYKQQREAVFQHYGKSCACCGEDEPMFLTIDHVNNDGAAHRKGNGGSAHNNIYAWLVIRKFPSGFQTLCRNCNEGKNRNGGVCPHVSKRFNDHPVRE